ncbi:MAG TPA: 23S rRNA (adenine(2503)-C(2))-methyltransferase RlmN [Thermodesulforhabdus norvegica]|uniref:Probable dual-specificity RNA methyltransferase RlmN n=1 Tax=Thermodesulforhabdus norvegica TaxID=39841 RepID=A0A7C0WW13_9BACT|nr:23S rRNA (adenine(2503)-C(2))-methyltransferase RlmN [Thermodesulforhabdus norvegica]
MRDGRYHIRNFTLPELEEWVQRLGEKRYRARQIFQHLYVRNVSSWDACTDLSKSFRAKLEAITIFDALVLKKEFCSSDGTRRFVFELRDGYQIESVFIPDPPRYTLCVSSQVGCPLGCAFCYTGSLGYRRNLTAGEIIEQYSQVRRALGSKPRITNIVFMGMGEPLLNEKELYRSLAIFLDSRGVSFSHRRITVSTVGIIPAMRRLGESYPVNLAVSLHAPTDELRNELVPINRRYPLSELIRACREYPLPRRKRITFEYVLLKGVNDSEFHARKLVSLLAPIRCKVNLIPFNPFPGSSFERPSEERILAFQRVLLDCNITTTIRTSRGLDILAACGQLAGNLDAREDLRQW